MSLGAYRYFGMQVQHGKGLAEQNLDRMEPLILYRVNDLKCSVRKVLEHGQQFFI